MKVLLLSAGLGTRLRPITDTLPKCLLPVAGKPLMAWWLEQLIQLGCEHIYINTHYLHKQVEAFIEASEYKSYVTLIHEPVLLGTLGSVRNLAQYLEGDSNFLIAHADNFCVTDWQKFVLAHGNRPKECDLTLMLFKTPTPESCGMVKTDDKGVIGEYVEKPKTGWHGEWANAAVMLLSPQALQDMLKLAPEYNDICRDFLPTMIRRMHSYQNQDILVDVGTVASLQLANDMAMAMRQGKDGRMTEGKVDNERAL